MLLANVDTSSLTWRHILTGAKCILLRLVKRLLHVRDLARKEKQIKWKKEIFAFPWLDLDGLGFSFLTEEKIRHLPVSRWPIHPEEIVTGQDFFPRDRFSIDSMSDENTCPWLTAGYNILVRRNVVSCEGWTVGRLLVHHVLADQRPSVSPQSSSARPRETVCDRAHEAPITSFPWSLPLSWPHIWPKKGKWGRDWFWLDAFFSFLLVVASNPDHLFRRLSAIPFPWALFQQNAQEERNHGRWTAAHIWNLPCAAVPIVHGESFPFQRWKRFSPSRRLMIEIFTG